MHIGTRALQTIHEEIQAHRPGIEVLGYETGGGIFGPPIRSWHTRADVKLATVAAGPRRPHELEIALRQDRSNRSEPDPRQRLAVSSHRRLARASDLSSRSCRRAFGWRHGYLAPRVRPDRPQPERDALPRHHRHRRPARLVVEAPAARLGRQPRRAAVDRFANAQHSPRVATHARRNDARPRPRRGELVTDVGDLAERALRLQRGSA